MAIPSFDELLSGILTDYKNLNGGITAGELIAKVQAYQALNGSVPDISAETLIRCACQASALWGAYKYQEYISRQPFPDTADSDNLHHHGSIQGVAPVAGETDTEYLARLLADIQNPSAGGNKYDYIKWAEEIDNVAQALCYPLAQGEGTVDVVLLADLIATGSELPSNSARMGRITAVSAGKLVDAAAAFTTAHAVAIGDVVENPAQGTDTTVAAVDSAGQLSLVDDIFKYADEAYIIHCQTGVNSAVAAGKLIDAAGVFTDATYVVRPGDVVQNVTDNTETTVVTKDSATQLSLVDDIFTGAGKTYVIKGLIPRVKTYIDSVRPVTASRVDVLAPSILLQAVTMGVTGQNVDRAKIVLDITAYLNSVDPDQTVFVAQLISIAIQDGAENVVLTVPAADVVPATYQMVRPGVITVT